MITIPEELVREESILEDISVDVLHVDYSYQRPLSPRKVREIAEDYNDIAAGTLLVNLRDDGYLYVMDGGHRNAAAKKAGRATVKCLIWSGLSLNQEAQVFIKCNSNRKQPDSLELYKARLFSGDAKALALKALVEFCGLEIAGYSGGGTLKYHPTRIAAVRAVETIYDKSGHDTTVFILSFLHAVWPDDGRKFFDRILLGFDLFHRTYKGQYNTGLLQKRLMGISIDSLLRDASTRIMLHDSEWRAVARTILGIYNWRKPELHRLPDRL